MDAQAAAGPPPALQQLLPYVASGSVALFSGISVVFRSMIHLISASSRSIFIFSPLPFFFYLLAPAFVFFQLVADIFVVLPYRTTLSLLDVFYPIYVFCGVACIAGGLVGLSGRLITGLLVEAAHDDHMRRRKLESVRRGKRVRVKVEREDQ
jgi:hypothetical protein